MRGCSGGTPRARFARRRTTVCGVRVALAANMRRITRPASLIDADFEVRVAVCPQSSHRATRIPKGQGFGPERRPRVPQLQRRRSRSDRLKQRPLSPHHTAKRPLGWRRHEEPSHTTHGGTQPTPHTPIGARPRPPPAPRAPLRRVLLLVHHIRALRRPPQRRQRQHARQRRQPHRDRPVGQHRHQRRARPACRTPRRRPASRPRRRRRRRAAAAGCRACPAGRPSPTRSRPGGSRRPRSTPTAWRCRRPTTSRCPTGRGSRRRTSSTVKCVPSASACGAASSRRRHFGPVSRWRAIQSGAWITTMNAATTSAAITAGTADSSGSAPDDRQRGPDQDDHGHEHAVGRHEVLRDLLGRLPVAVPGARQRPRRHRDAARAAGGDQARRGGRRQRDQRRALHAEHDAVGRAHRGHVPRVARGRTRPPARPPPPASRRAVPDPVPRVLDARQVRDQQVDDEDRDRRRPEPDQRPAPGGPGERERVADAATPVCLGVGIVSVTDRSEHRTRPGRRLDAAHGRTRSASPKPSPTPRAGRPSCPT